MEPESELNSAVAEAVSLVNRHSGETSIHLCFADDPAGIDFIANAARLDNGRFEFQAGFETYGGAIDELANIEAVRISH